MSLAILVLVSFVLSLLFALGGVGSAIALVPILNMFDYEMSQARSIGLLVTFAATSVASFSTIKDKTLDKNLFLPLLISSVTFSILGVFYSHNLDMNLIQILFIAVLFFSASMMLFTKKTALVHSTSIFSLLLIGSFSGFTSGILGIGGGLIMAPLLIFIGYKSKSIALLLSPIIALSVLLALISNISLYSFDFKEVLLFSCAGALGGYIGNYLMKHYLKDSHIKKLLALLLYLLAIRLLFPFIM